LFEVENDIWKLFQTIPEKTVFVNRLFHSVRWTAGLRPENVHVAAMAAYIHDPFGERTHRGDDEIDKSGQTWYKPRK